MTIPSETAQPATESTDFPFPPSDSETPKVKETFVSFPHLPWKRRIHLGIEMTLIFTIAPVLLVTLKYYGLQGFLFPAIWCFAIGCVIFLQFDKSFDRKSYWRFSAIFKELPRLLILFSIGIALMFSIVMIFIPDQLFFLPRRVWWLWLIIMFGYPILSVYAQGIIYRVFFFHRYRGVFTQTWMLILIGAAFFSFAHLVMGNWVALGLTLLGGVLFGWTYVRTESAMAAWLEHSLYGCLLFTIGMGSFIFAGNRQLAREAPKYRSNIAYMEQYRLEREAGQITVDQPATQPQDSP